MSDYELIDSGDGQKLERLGSFVLKRPCAQAFWKPYLPNKEWEKADASFSRESNQGWSLNNSVPQSWEIKLGDLTFTIERSSFGHVGLFFEHPTLWNWIEKQIGQKKDFSILNLFGYTGATTLFAASCGAQVCHLDASKKIVETARQNAHLNEMEDLPIRWIVDDVFKFLKREAKRERKYDGIILDPPSFGRGAKGEVFKLEEDLHKLLESVQAVLSDQAKFVLFTCHTPGITPMILKNILQQFFTNAEIETGELFISSNSHKLPKGIYGKCVFK